MANLNNARRKAVKITLNDGVERELKFTLNAMADLEDKFGSVEAAFAEVDKGSIKALRFILWCGLAHADETLTERQVGNLIDMQYLAGLTDTVGAALGADLPDVPDDTDARALPPAQDPNV